MAPRHLWRRGVGRTFQITAAFASMTVRENVQLALLPRASVCAGPYRPDARSFDDGGRRAARAGRHARGGRAALRHSRLWRSQARRARDRARRRAEALADGRADRRNGARRAPATDGAGRRASPSATASPCCSPSTTWTWCSPMPTASSCSIAARSLLQGAPEAIRADPAVRAVYLGAGLASGVDR